MKETIGTIFLAEKQRRFKRKKISLQSLFPFPGVNLAGRYEDKAPRSYGIASTLPQERTAPRIDPNDVVKVMPVGNMAEWNVLSKLLKRNAEAVIDLRAPACQTEHRDFQRLTGGHRSLR
jgi:hypothetical protein